MTAVIVLHVHVCVAHATWQDLTPAALLPAASTCPLTGCWISAQLMGTNADLPTVLQVLLPEDHSDILAVEEAGGLSWDMAALLRVSFTTDLE